MSIFGFKGVVSGGMLGEPLGVAQFHVQGDQLILSSDSAMGAITLNLNDGSLAQSSTAYSINPGSGTRDVSWGAEQFAFSIKDLNLVLSASSDSSSTIYAENSGAYVDAFEAVRFEQSGNTYVALAASTGDGLATYQVASNGTLTEVDFVTGGFGGYTDHPSALTVVEMAGSQYVIAVSASANTVTSFSVATDGTLTPASQLGVAQYLPIDTPQDIATVTIDGQAYVVMAAAGSSSLTVLAVAENGNLTAVDQIMDDLGTRLEGVHLIESFTVGDHAYVLAAGQDSGISLFAIAPGGQMVHLDTVVDEEHFPIDTISDMHVMQVGDEFQLFTASSSEAGIGQFTLELGLHGVVATVGASGPLGTNGRDILIADAGGRSINGRGGDDIIFDGAGSDTLTGGNGADIFIFGKDGQTDTITDFQPGIDSLDLTGLGFYRSIDQLTVTSTSNGARLQFGTEVIFVQTINGASLTEADFTNANTINATHVDTNYVMAALTDFSVSATVTLGEVVSSFSTVVPAYAGDLTGGGGDDVMAGDASDQTITGAAGHDVLRGGDGADALYGGAGIDLADYADATTGVIANLGDATVNTGFAAG
ncbi:MAG: M10 family metallopeptidase C-terminal domain-containing protein, partial [Planktomarina sp.]